MVGSDFYTYCKKRFKRTDKETEFYEVLTDVIMDMKLRFKSEDFKTITTALTIDTLGGYTITLPTDFGHIIGDVVFQDSYRRSWPLHKISKERFDTLYPNPGASDATYEEPYWYCIYGKTIYIGPAPDKTTYTYQLNYTQEAATTMTSATTIPFTDRYRWIVRDIVLGEFYELIKNYDEAQFYKDKGNIGLQKIALNEENYVDAPTTVAYRDI